MKAHLLYRDADFDVKSPDPPGAADLEQDLELGYLLDAMADGDSFTGTVARTAMLHPLLSPEAVRYRQEALEDCARNRDFVARLYELTERALDAERGGLFFLLSNGRPEYLLRRAVGVLRNLLPIIDELRQVAEAGSALFRSVAFLGFFATIRTELDDAAFQGLRSAVRRLELRGGLLMSASLAPGGAVEGQVLRLPRDENRRLLSRTAMKRPSFSFTIPDRDEAGFDALAALQDRSVNDVANAASQSLDHVRAFFASLRAELAFYLGCIRLGDRLSAIGVPLTMPAPEVVEATGRRAVGLVDPCLALRAGRLPVGNDVHPGARRLLVVTGANHGGKSTFLRSLGVGQLMMQAGMFVPAREFADLCVGAIFTHWAREEDEELLHGKLDEELARMGIIIDAIRPGDLLLSNESFSSTNESEGSEIALQVVQALLHSRVEVRLVTHLYSLAAALQALGTDHVAFLRAPRRTEAGHSYRLEEGPPLPTSWGIDLFDERFGTHLGSSPPPPGADG